MMTTNEMETNARMFVKLSLPPLFREDWIDEFVACW